MFDWMGLKQRKMPKEIDCVSMRPWDTFFWWLEVEGLAAEIDGRPRQLAAAENRPPRADRRQAPGNEQSDRQRAGRAKSPSGCRPSWSTSIRSSSSK